MGGLGRSRLPGVDGKLEQDNKSRVSDRDRKFRNCLTNVGLEPNVKKVDVFKMVLEFTTLLMIT